MSSTLNLKMRDVAMIAQKSRLIVEVYIPNKPDIKAHLVSESKSGYARSMEVYIRKTLRTSKISGFRTSGFTAAQ